ncbi:PDxFFG protein [Mesomycoplasma lagogenitalium]|uniref:PDxFFG protein n=1 Tax=Mesomycoplasma lagogenitalium TaxID=171286 RepID=A0ABY8LXL8_9BACT|nr:PDxFFG protein [Mesomycoplasma lagogenitalium]WGI37016.1 PDxFFG protein [Mesomycoplasma lagogenitalium]
MVKKKLSLTAKLLISAGIIVVGSGAAIGSMFLYANNSDAVHGKLSGLSNEAKSNDFSKIRDENGKLQPIISIVDPLKEKAVAKINEQGSEFWFLDDEKTKYNFDDFFAKYYEKYQESFYLEVKYGSFNFYNEYVLAVKPKEFVEFTKWFFDNVSWGPDLLTLDTFRLVPGVEQNGNSITLGSHSTEHKEVSEIKFFPDAFFGSLPIYSQLGGEGNAVDSLATKAFSDLQSKEVLDQFLKDLPVSSVIKNHYNETNNSFLELINPQSLINKKYLMWVNKTEKENGKGTLLLPENADEKLYNEILEKYKVDKKLYPFSEFKKGTITNVSSSAGSAPALTLTLLLDEDKDKPVVNNKTYEVSFKMNEADATENWNLTYSILKTDLNAKMVHFLDFYGVKFYENKKLFYYENEKEKRFFKSKSAALENLNVFKSYDQLSQTEKDKLKEYSVKSIDVVDGILKLVLESQSQDNKTVKEFSFDSKSMTSEQNDQFFELKEALGYNGAITPVTLNFSQENPNLKDENGNKLEGLATRSYQVLYEVYNGLIEKVVKKFPHLLKVQQGPHLEKKINDKGYYEYELVDGQYRGFSEDDRIGLPLLLAATIDNFEGISTDFLRYVAAHEYGHHLTLDQANAWNTGDQGVVIGGMNVRAGIAENSFYAENAVRNYLLARTNLDFERVSVNGIPTPDGKFIRFKFITKDGQTVIESEEDIWGSLDRKGNILHTTLANKRRRFLQTFDGLKEAAQLRNVNLGDLFIANSLDENSGTLNPQIFGPNKLFVKKTVKNADGSESVIYQLENSDLKKILEFLEDGKGNKFNDKAEWNTNNTLSKINFLEYGTKEESNSENQQPNVVVDKNKVVKNNFFNKDNSPIVNVPLYSNENQQLLDEDLAKYKDKKIETISNAISSLSDLTFGQSGWNNRETFMGGEPSTYFKIPFSAFDNVKQGLANNLLNRSKVFEHYPQLNLIWNSGNTVYRTSNEFTAISSNNLAVQLATMWNAWFNQVLEYQNNRYSGFIEVANNGTTLEFVNLNGQTLNIAESYFFPKKKEAYLLNAGYAINDSINSQIKSVGNQLGFGNPGDLQINPNLTFLFEGLGISAANVPSLTYGNNLPAKRANFVIYNEQNQVIKPNDLYLHIRLLASDGNTNFLTGQNATYTTNKQRYVFNVSKIGYNLDDKFNDNSLYKSFADNLNGLTFDNLSKLYEFGSVDYSKATRTKVISDANGNQYASFDWDINYVKSKFNFEKFKNSVLDSHFETQAIKNLVNSGDQEIANEIMARFVKSDYFIAVKNFNPLKDLVKNQAIFSQQYGIDIHSDIFKNSLVYDVNALPEDQKTAKFDVEQLQNNVLVNYLTSIVGKENYTDEFKEYVGGQDLMRSIGNLVVIKDQGKIFEPLFENFVMPFFSDGRPSSDIINYNSTRVESQLADKFTDYIFNFAETLTRDYVITTYVPNTKPFGNLPEFISNLSEANSGLDYIVDATKLEIWNSRKNDINAVSQSIDLAIKASKTDEFLRKSWNTYKEHDNNIKEAKDYHQSMLKKGRETNDPIEKAKYLELEKTAFDLYNEAIKKRNDEVSKIRKEVYGAFYNKKIANTRNFRLQSSYFGRFMTKNNGYFKDISQKEIIGMELYDKDGNDYKDDSIRLTDLDGKKINTRAKAFFVSQLKTFGVGSRDISGIFRNKEKDAVAFYGFMKTEELAKIKKIKFTDLNTNEVKYLKINSQGTNNLFYLSKLGDPNSKVTLADFGYSSWVSDYEIMAKYRDALLKPKHNYLVEFVDENDNFVKNMSMGDLKFISENGKTDLQAPITLEKTEFKKEDKIEEKAVLKIDYQFNITG